MAILKPTTPSTTESATNRIDLDSLSAALTAAGWERRDPVILNRDHRQVALHGSKRISVIERWGDNRLGTVNLLDPIWSHALDLIRAHTTPARSPDDACPTAEEER